MKKTTFGYFKQRYKRPKNKQTTTTETESRHHPILRNPVLNFVKLCLHEIEYSSNHLESESHIPPDDLLSESLKRSLPSMPGFLFT